MEKILEQLNEVVRIANQRVKEVELERAEIAAKKNELETLINENKENSKKLAVRESAVKEIEHIKMTIEEAISIRKKAEDEASVIKNNRANFNVEKDALNKKIKDEMSEIDRRKKKMLGEREKLETDRKEYKVKVIEEVNKMIDKNKVKV